MHCRTRWQQDTLMSLDNITNYFERFIRASSASFQSERFEEALTSAIKGYAISSELRDLNQKTVCLRLIWKAAHELIDKPDREEVEDARQGRRCSFCPRRIDEIQIVRGIYGAICRLCADSVIKQFDDPSDPEGGASRD
jgi:hypothetical protein